MRARLLAILSICALTAPAAGQTPSASQPPWKAKNLQFYPADITRDVLTQRMREFSFALNVRCQYCHAGGDGVSFDGVDFASDDKPAKKKARAMLKMTDEIFRRSTGWKRRTTTSDCTSTHASTCCATRSQRSRLASIRNTSSASTDR
jgi:hypothetical protein